MKTLLCVLALALGLGLPARADIGANCQLCSLIVSTAQKLVNEHAGRVSTDRKDTDASRLEPSVDLSHAVEGLEVPSLLQVGSTDGNVDQGFMAQVLELPRGRDIFTGVSKRSVPLVPFDPQTYAGGVRPLHAGPYPDLLADAGIGSGESGEEEQEEQEADEVGLVQEEQEEQTELTEAKQQELAPTEQEEQGTTMLQLRGGGMPSESAETTVDYGTVKEKQQLMTEQDTLDKISQGLPRSDALWRAFPPHPGTPLTPIDPQSYPGGVRRLTIKDIRMSIKKKKGFFSLLQSDAEPESLLQEGADRVSVTGERVSHPRLRQSAKHHHAPKHRVQHPHHEKEIEEDLVHPGFGEPILGPRFRQAVKHHHAHKHRVQHPHHEKEIEEDLVHPGFGEPILGPRFRQAVKHHHAHKHRVQHPHHEQAKRAVLAPQEFPRFAEASASATTSASAEMPSDRDMASAKASMPLDASLSLPSDDLSATGFADDASFQRFRSVLDMGIASPVQLPPSFSSAASTQQSPTFNAASDVSAMTASGLGGLNLPRELQQQAQALTAPPPAPALRGAGPSMRFREGLMTPAEEVDPALADHAGVMLSSAPTPGGIPLHSMGRLDVSPAYNLGSLTPPAASLARFRDFPRAHSIEQLPKYESYSQLRSFRDALSDIGFSAGSTKPSVLLQVDPPIAKRALRLACKYHAPKEAQAQCLAFVNQAPAGVIQGILESSPADAICSLATMCENQAAPSF
jgi:hypothetical protein